MDAGMEVELIDCCNCTTACVGFVVTIVIFGAGRLELHVEKSVIIHNCPRWWEWYMLWTWGRI